MASTSNTPAVAPADVLARLERIIAERCSADPSSSYVAQLSQRGTAVMARKFGEEAVELVVAALAEDRQELIGEAADTLFHMLIVLQDKGIALSEVMAELERREGLSGLEEKARRGT